ncbi:hypothetical protein DL991_18630 [Amycolatopsis sp. WAC 01375]|uniref:hypothetical protein n=1 Tax=Amycolatopsis sp. WAC 01375 TaxID=2203194 RepID=UPI000F7A4EAB|nr:hypothetical protein [Amycolatopsis sp. WAC 01375]RSM78100.1 hypothetical protein DL991_18630 [Amycolatopsis sp. WAC 01375]
MFSILSSTPRPAPTTASRTRRRRRRTAAAAGVAAVGLVFASAPAATAAPASVVRDFYVDYGASYASGTATFTNRSVILDGTLHAVGCGRVIYGDAYAGPNDSDYLGSGSSTPRCDGNWPFHVPVPADKPGGADRVLITLAAPDGYDAVWVFR